MRRRFVDPVLSVRPYAADQRRDKDDLQDETGHDRHDRLMRNRKVLSGSFYIRWEQTAEHDDSDSSSPRRDPGDLEPSSDCDFGEACDRNPGPCVSHRLGNHADQFRSSFAPVGGGGQQEHNSERRAQSYMPVCKVMPFQSEDSKDDERCNETDERCHGFFSDKGCRDSAKGFTPALTP